VADFKCDSDSSGGSSAVSSSCACASQTSTGGTPPPAPPTPTANGDAPSLSAGVVQASSTDNPAQDPCVVARQACQCPPGSVADFKCDSDGSGGSSAVSSSCACASQASTGGTTTPGTSTPPIATDGPSTDASPAEQATTDSAGQAQQAAAHGDDTQAGSSAAPSTLQVTACCDPPATCNTFAPLNTRACIKHGHCPLPCAGCCDGGDRASCCRPRDVASRWQERRLPSDP
jgi:hypothetical protein